MFKCKFELVKSVESGLTGVDEVHCEIKKRKKKGKKTYSQTKTGYQHASRYLAVPTNPVDISAFIEDSK